MREHGAEHDPDERRDRHEDPEGPVRHAHLQRAEHRVEGADERRGQAQKQVADEDYEQVAVGEQRAGRTQYSFHPGGLGKFGAIPLGGTTLSEFAHFRSLAHVRPLREGAMGKRQDQSEAARTPRPAFETLTSSSDRPPLNAAIRVPVLPLATTPPCHPNSPV